MRTLTVINQCMSREVALGNWKAYAVLAALYRDLVALNKRYGRDISKGDL